jgi:RNA polymerase sigma factor (sigma-70 family)
VRHEPTDGALINASRADPGSFVELFRRHYPAIHGYLRRRVESEVAEDLAAQTFLEAFDARAKFDTSRGSAKPWLYAIATNLLRHHRRSEQRHLRALIRSGSPHVGIEPNAPPDLPQHELLLQALRELRDDDRDVLLLFAWADLQYKEIAEALGVPIGTVRSRLNRARKHIKERLLDASRSATASIPGG